MDRNGSRPGTKKVMVPFMVPEAFTLDAHLMIGIDHRAKQCYANAPDDPAQALQLLVELQKYVGGLLLQHLQAERPEPSRIVTPKPGLFPR